MNKGQYNLLKRGVSAWNKYREDIPGVKIDLGGAYLYRAYLYRSDLSGANIRGADIRGANLIEADLYRSDLSGANIRGANIRGADLRGATYIISEILLTNWANLSDEMTLELMRHDAEFCGQKKMDDWAKSGKCPFENSCRNFIFVEKKSLWAPGNPKYRGKELFEKLCEEKGIEL